MDFELSDIQSAVLEAATQILEPRHPQPGAPPAPNWPDRDLWHDLAETGLLAAPLTTQVGDEAADFVAMCLLLKECGRAHARVPARVCLLTAMALERFGGGGRFGGLLAQVASGKAVITAAAADKFGGDAAPSLTATADGGGYRLSGHERFVHWGGSADEVLVFARAPEGVIAALVNPHQDGIRREALDTTSGTPEADLYFNGAAVAAEKIAADAASGGAMRAWLWQRFAVACAAELAGAAAAALKLTAAYTGEREQFGRKLGSFQAVAMHAADAFIAVEAMDLAMLQAAWRLSAGRDAARELSIAKFWASDGATRVLEIAHRLHGGAGVVLDYPLHRYLTSVKHLSLACGSAHWHLERLGDIIAKRELEAVGSGGEPSV